METHCFNVALEKLGKKHNSYSGAEIEWFILTKLCYILFDRKLCYIICRYNVL